MTIHSNDGQSGQTKLDRISELSGKDSEMVFNNLGHLINVPLLTETFYRLDGTKAIGIDSDKSGVCGMFRRKPNKPAETHSS